jgi:3'(2'), 5'-bisphosphate nucleotidase
MEIKLDYKLIINAAKEASKSILEIYQHPQQKIWLKEDNSPLTLADKTSHEIIMKSLSKTGIPVLSEEGKNIPYEKRKHWEYFWLVDPLDGTKEFLNRNDEFTVNIALIHKNNPVWGIIMVPVSGKCYYGGPGEGAFLQENEHLLELKPSVKLWDKNSKGQRIVISRSHLDKETKAFISDLKDPVLISMGSSLKFMMLAEGKADIYPRFAPTMEWDTAAAQAILNGLGWEIYSLDNGLPLTYNKKELVNPGFVAKAKS